MWQDDPLGILADALETHEPSSVFAMVSGGNDSLALLHWAKHNAPLTAAVHIDTGTALPGVRDHVEKTAAALDVPLIVLETPPSVYEGIVKAHGTPGPGAHLYPYALLKERRLRDLRREYSSHRKDRVMLLMGARRHESVRRMSNSRAISRDGNSVFVNPPIDWTTVDTHRYRAAHGLQLSETAAICHRSGECNCGAFASPTERDELRMWFPDWFEWVEHWERLGAQHGHGWKWGERPPVAAVKRMTAAAGQLGVFGIGPMCEGCVA
jgi:3'-phosphoadenosine 5'-phosphosulfate sulfotransferase (PAPS reductase)/FAD synthetase